MSEEQIREHAQKVAAQVFEYVFMILDATDLSGELAGRIAQACQDVVEKELIHCLKERI